MIYSPKKPRPAGCAYILRYGSIFEMSSKTGAYAHLDRYNALSVPDQTILQALSALYEPAAAPVIASCLTGAGLRESPLRAFSPQNVAVRLARLAKAGFAEESQVESRGQKVRLWQCRPEAGEIAIRHAVRDGRFLPIAKAALSETRGRDWNNIGAGDSQARRFRLSFHAGDWRSALTVLTDMARETPGRGGALFAELAVLQPDDSWRRTAKPALFAPVLALALRDMAAGLANPEPLDELASEQLAAGGPGGKGEELIFALVDMLALRGKVSEAAKTAELADLEETRLAAAVVPALIEDAGDVSALAEKAMAQRRTRLGARETLFPGLGAVWQALAVMRADAPDAIDTMLKRLSAPAAQEHDAQGALSCLRHAFLFMAGQSYAAKSLPDEPPDRHPITVLAHALSMLRVDPARLRPLAGGLDDWRRRAQQAGYRWLAAQFQAIAAAARGEDESAANPRWPPLTRLFRGDDEWRRGLRALEDLVSDEGDGGAAPRKRLAWLVGFPSRPADPFVPFDIQPVEQTLQKDGNWSKGRNVALRRVFQRSNDLSFATDQDGLVFSALRYDFDGVTSGYHFDVAAALHYLVGHPLVYRDDAGGARMDIVSGEFELSVTDREGGCEITLEPSISEFAPEDSGPSEIAAGELPDTLARLETPTRLRVLRLGGRERKLAQVVGDGLSVPARGREEALRTLARLSTAVRLHSDLPELAGEGEMVEADARPRFHIMPQNPGLKVEVWAHPLGDQGPAYRPGKGGRILAAELDGRTVRTARNKRKEKELAEQALASCPSLTGHEDGDLSWRLDVPEDALSFMAEAGELDERAVLAWPRGGRFRVRRIKGMGGLSLRVNSSSEWFEVAGSLRVDEDLVIDMDRLLASLKQSSGKFVEIGDGEYIALTDELRRQLGDLEALGETQGGTLRLSALAGSVLEGLEEAGADLLADDEWRRSLEKRKHLADFSPDPPANFRAELRNYQLEGFRWMARLAELGAGACLADDMGLGKTIQALAMLVRRSGLGPSLVVAPTSVCHNWIRETKRFAPGLTIQQFGEGNREAQLSGLAPGDVIITSYSLLRQEEKLFANVQWATAVLDEAQAIKNVAAKRSKAAMALNAGFRLITTGTPIENHLGELWNLFHFINPRLLGSARKFQERFAAPIERLRDKEASDRLRRAIRPFILRRTKGQVLDSLPPKTEITLAVELGEKERAFYESLRRSAVERLESDPQIAEKKRFQILAEIMRLRRCCCSPELITGDIAVPSAKQEQFRSTLADLVENGHKVLVFSQFVDHLSIIRRYLDREGFSYQYLDGSTPAKNRKKAVDDFQAGQGDVFLISLKAGGLGLNLTAADYVIHMDPWWNPAVEDQASDRAHRIGQDKPVTVYRLVAAGTIEEKIVQLHSDKRDLADNLLSGADQAAGLDLDEIMRLLRE